MDVYGKCYELIIRGIVMNRGYQLGISALLVILTISFLTGCGDQLDTFGDPFNDILVILTPELTDCKNCCRFS